MGSHRRAAALGWALLVIVAGCTFPPLETPSPRPIPTLQPTATSRATPSPSPTLTAEPTPDAALLPSFDPGEIVASAIDGLRVRQNPGLSSRVVAGLLPLAAELELVMGPIMVDGNGWLLVRDADPDGPDFEEGWIASGFEPEPYVASTGRVAESGPYLAGFAQTGNAEYGPVEIDDGDHLVRWVAVDPERVRCQFGVSLGIGSTAPVAAIRATVGNGVDPGTLQPGSFAALGLRGPAFVTVESDCAWTLVILRVTPEPSPSAASPAP